MSRTKSSRTQRWLSVIIPSAVLVAGVFLLGHQAVSSAPRTSISTPDGTARVSFEERHGQGQTPTGQSLVVRMNNWQATSITSGCHKVN